MHKMNLKAFAAALIVAVILNLVFFAFGKISQFWFWIIAIIIAFIAYKILPKLKNKDVKNHSS